MGMIHEPADDIQYIKRKRRTARGNEVRRGQKKNKTTKLAKSRAPESPVVSDFTHDRLCEMSFSPWFRQTNSAVDGQPVSLSLSLTT